MDSFDGPNRMTRVDDPRPYRDRYFQSSTGFPAARSRSALARM